MKRLAMLLLPLGLGLSACGGGTSLTTTAAAVTTAGPTTTTTISGDALIEAYAFNNGFVPAELLGLVNHVCDDVQNHHGDVGTVTVYLADTIGLQRGKDFRNREVQAVVANLDHKCPGVAQQVYGW